MGLSVGAAQAEVIRMQVVKVESPTFDGRVFGTVGRYEKVIARATMAVNPADPHNTIVVDISLAPRNAEGRVEFATDVVILRPVDLSKANKRIFFTVINRGNNNSLPLFNDVLGGSENNPTAAEDAGNGYLMREGYTLVWSGWQGDVLPGDGRIKLDVPMLNNVTGIDRMEFIFNHTNNPAEGTLLYPAADLDPAKATLTVRQKPNDPRTTPAGLSFSFKSPTTVVINRPPGFDGGAIYELIYQAREPKVMGLGFAATRDIISFLRREKADRAGNPNPLALNGVPIIERAYAFGRSQSGRFLRDFLYQGFDEDEKGRIVFDGLMPHIAGSRKMFTNFRFAKPGVFSKQHEEHLTPGDQFPFTYGILTDPVTGKRDGILARCLATNNCPKVIQTDTASEYYQARASLVVTDTQGQDLVLPDNVRVFALSSTPHGSQNTAVGTPQMLPSCQFVSNPLHNGAPMRALLKALDRWVSTGVAPPASRYPKRSDGTLVPPEPASTGFPSIPGVAAKGLVNPIRATDYDTQPPREGGSYPVLVAKVDADGNDLGGLRLPWVDAPLATYVGWNLRRAGFAEGELCELNGSTFPLAATKAERLENNDPRLSLEERYPTPESYIDQIRQSVDRLVRDGLMLPEDGQWYVERAKQVKVGSQD
ncbi:MAG: hypothetical protein IT176_11265 [Acidobacteria bacterium]|nr:hypothetical protein [Acidobacteriota bacterium]